MAIEYVEIRDGNTDIIGIVDMFKSVIWRSVYFGVGDFEIYTQATPEALNLLQEGRYVTRPDNVEVGIIEKVVITDDQQDGTMIAASGRFAKSILTRRLIYNLSGTQNKATVLRGNVETNIRQVVSNNAISCAFNSKRNISLLELGAVAGISATIVDENGYAAQKQVSYEELMTYTDSVLAEYGLAARVILDRDRRKFQYVIYQGADRSVTNSAGIMPVIFSKEYDNLSASEYSFDSTQEKNAALIGGEGEGLARFYSTVEGTETDLQRREVWVDASSISKTYKDDSDVEKTYTDTEYKTMLNAQGKQSLAPLVIIESLSGTLDITNGNYVYDRDFSLGDIVTCQENNIGVYVNVRIREATEVQDQNGYTVEATYQ